MKQMLTPVLAMAFAATLVAEAMQTPPATTAAKTQAGTTTDLTVEKSASPELVGSMTKELGITPMQAQGGSGALLGLAKSRLKPEEFAKVSAAVPGTDGLLAAAPAVGGKGGGMMGMAAGAGGGAAGLASLAGSFNQLGLKPDMAAKMAPVLIGFVKNKGAGEAASLLTGVLK